MAPKRVLITPDSKVKIPPSRILKQSKKTKGNGPLDFQDLKESEIFPLICIGGIMLLGFLYYLPFTSFLAAPFIEIPHNIPIQLDNSTTPGPSYDVGFFDLTYFTFVFLVIVVIAALISEVLAMFTKNYLHTSKKDKSEFSRNVTDSFFYLSFIFWGSSLFTPSLIYEFDVLTTTYIPNQKLYLISQAAYSFKIIVDYLLRVKEENSSTNFYLVVAYFLGTVSPLCALMLKHYHPALILTTSYNISLFISTTILAFSSVSPKSHLLKLAKQIDVAFWIIFRFAIPVLYGVLIFVYPSEVKEGQTAQKVNSMFVFLFIALISSVQSLWLKAKLLQK